MNESSQLHRQAFIDQLCVDGELCAVNGQTVYAIIDRQPRLFDMQDAGYLDKQPVNIEVLKGEPGSTETFGPDSQPLDLRGFTPIPRSTLAIVDGVNKKVMTVQDAVDRWILTTITLNV
jgi:hypothetical protein